MRSPRVADEESHCGFSGNEIIPALLFVTPFAVCCFRCHCLVVSTFSIPPTNPSALFWVTQKKSAIRSMKTSGDVRIGKGLEELLNRETCCPL